MSNYTKTVDFESKDALASGDPNKKIKGQEIDDEFDAIATASATKTDKVTPATTGDFATLGSDGNLQDSGKTPPSGEVVGTTDTQTLTNKTLTSPTINTPTITTPTLTLKQSASPTPTAEGDIQWDTDDNSIKVGDGASTKTFTDDSNKLLTTNNLSDVGSAVTALENLGLYSGEITSAGASVRLPSGWSAARNGTGDYTITHNLGSIDYAVAVQPRASSVRTSTEFTHGTNSFRFKIYQEGIGVTDTNCGFILSAW